MGYNVHHTIVVTDYAYEESRQLLLTLQEFARKQGLRVSEIVQSNINGHGSIFIAPDGSKQGWDTSNRGDGARAAVINLLKQWRNTGISLAWVEVQYDDDDMNTEIVQAANKAKVLSSSDDVKGG